MLSLRNRVFCFLRASSPLLPSHLQHRHCLLHSTPTPTFTSASAAPFSLEDYLVRTCGLTPSQARKASKKAFREASRLAKKPFEDLSSRLNSASNPDAVLALLSGVGLSRAEIAAVVAADPLLLRSSVKNIGPRLLFLRDRFGLSTPQIARFLLVGSTALRCSDIGQNVEFLISIFGSVEKLLVILKRNKYMLTRNFDRVIKPNVAQLRQCGLSVRDIAHMCSRNSWVLSFNPERLKEHVLRVEELGLSHTSPMFKFALASASFNKEKLAARLEFLKKALGCSDSEVSIALSRMPSILGISEENILRKIEFLVNEVGMEPQYIVQRPILLGYCLEKRLVPRYRVMKVLQAKGLLSSNTHLFSLIHHTEETFRLKFVDCHKDSVTGLTDAYAAACACDVPS